MATPIGNLGDVTLRALEVLRSVPLIAAEDTRHTHRLLDRHEVETRTTSYHARSGPGRAAALLEHLRGGADLALVTDAGTPAVSDPGGDLVAAWAAEGGTVVPIPGASAVLAAVVASGSPARAGASRGSCRGAAASGGSGWPGSRPTSAGPWCTRRPGRVAATLRDLAAACGAERPGAVCRELTKLHETIERGTLGELAAMAADGAIPARGEFALVVGAWVEPAPAVADAGRGRSSRRGAGRGRRASSPTGSARSEAARRVAAATGLPRRQLYDADEATGSMSR